MYMAGCHATRLLYFSIIVSILWKVYVHYSTTVQCSSKLMQSDFPYVTMYSIAVGEVMGL